MIDSLMSSITDKIIDTAVDGAVDKAKNALKASTTYVWTAVNKETHSGRIANLIFVNTLGQRKHVAYENLSSFIENNYVSNVVVRDGKVEILGCHLNDLPDYQLGQDGQYRVYGLHNEQWVYDKAYVYIQSQERKMQEDIQNHCLKGNNNQETQTNITSNIKAIKDISTATAITAVTAAGAASVAGATVAGKAIYKQLNKKKIIEMQENICNKLNKYDKILESLIKMKGKTNNIIQSNPDILEYNSRLEAQQDTSRLVRDDVLRFGVNECINKVKTVIDQCNSTAIANKIIDEPLNRLNGLSSISSYGTLKDYINKLYSRLSLLNQQHEITRQLINNNIQRKQNDILAENQRRQKEIELENQRIQEEQRQNRLITEVNDYIQEIGTKLERFINEGLDRIEEKQTELNNLHIDNLINKVNNKLSQLTDYDTKINLQRKTNEYKDKLNDIQQKINRKINSKVDELKNSMVDTMNSMDIKIEELMSGKYDNTEYLNIVNDINIKASDIRMNLSQLLSSERNTIEQRLNNIENKLNSNRRSIELGIKKAETDNKSIYELENILEQYENSLSSLSNSKDVKRDIDKFISTSKIYLNKINNSTLLNEWRQKIEDKTTKFNELYTDKLRLEENEKERLNEIGDSLINELKNEIQRIENFNVAEITEEQLNEFNINTDDIEKQLKENNFELRILRDIKNNINTLNYKYRQKKNEAQSIINTEKRATNNIENNLLSIQNRINTMNKCNKDRTLNSINNIKTSIDYNRIRNKDWIDIKIDELTVLYNEKAKEFEI